ncbi:MAG TPA: hypothetical protein VGL77_12415 [Armatimonadota bacterium]
MVMAVLLGMCVFTPLPGRASQDGVALKIYGMPFNQLVTELVKQKGGKKLLLLENVSTPVDVVAPESTPIDKILATVSASVGLDFWQDDDTYYIGKRNKPVTASPSSSNPGPTIDKNPPLISKAPVSEVAAPAPPVAKKMIIGSIELQNTSASEMAWMLGVGTSKPTAARRKQLGTRIESVLDPRHPKIKQQDLGSGYSSPMLNSTSPWLSGRLSNESSVTDGNQVFGGDPTINPGGAINPGYATPMPVAPIAPAVTNTAATNTNGNTTSTVSGLLKDFIPDGIDSIIGIEGLNTLLIRAQNQDAIDQLASFIKLLDRPTKQCVIEVMFVKMTVTDAMTLGTSFSVNGSPWTVNNTAPTSSSGNFSLQYAQGNIQFKLAAFIQSSRAKVINAPRIIVQNGATDAYITLSDSIPFVITSQQEDVYGKITSVPTISTQTFDQGMTVNEVLIHPDKSVTLNVTPLLESPTDTVAIPGTDNAGSVSGTTSQEINTRVRVKNGETVMMGGFVSDNESVGVTKTPLLGDLPIIGPLLFRNTNKNTNNTETMIFITPTVMDDDPTNFEGMSTLPPLF